MSLVISKNKKSREFKLKLSSFLHFLYNIHATFFPGINPGSYNNALGYNRFKKWYERKRKIGLLELLTFSIILTPGGTYLLTQDHANILGWFLTLWGVSCTVLLFWENHSSNEERDEKYEQLAGQHKKLQQDFEEFKTKFENL